MPAITSLIALAGVAAGIGGTISAKAQAKKQAKAAKKQADKAAAAMMAKDPSKKTGAAVKLAAADRDRKRGKGSLAQRNRASALAVQSASSVGGL